MSRSSYSEQSKRTIEDGIVRIDSGKYARLERAYYTVEGEQREHETIRRPRSQLDLAIRSNVQSRRYDLRSVEWSVGIGTM